MKVISSMSALPYCNITVAEITKEDAKAILAKNSKNRNLLKSNVSILKDTMNDGHWMFNGDSIVVDKDGFLKSGQHRLTAFVDSELDHIPVIIVYLNNEQDVLCSLNRGRPLTCSQYLKIRNIPNCNRVAAISRILHSLINGTYGKDEFNKKIADYKLESIYIKYKEYYDLFINGASLHSRQDLTSPMLGAVVFASIMNLRLIDPLVFAVNSVHNFNIPDGSIAQAFARIRSSKDTLSGSLGAYIILQKTLSVIAYYSEHGRVQQLIRNASIEVSVKTIKAHL